MYAERMRKKGITSLDILTKMNTDELKRSLNAVFKGSELSDKRRLTIALEQTKTNMVAIKLTETPDTDTDTDTESDSVAHFQEIKECENELMQTIDDKFEQKERILDEQLRQILEIESQIKRTMENAEMLCNCGCAGDAEKVLLKKLYLVSWEEKNFVIECLLVKRFKINSRNYDCNETSNENCG
ncbi:hypothetical protein RFI_20879 [Reticulomyxa filosa]|uniref:Uncharacterized protein n=1 Tax=Reticulomyxa filosa TaxID=46433 RepID=X6MR47_RETFI|nr:hypothetical protein RFI_20879 [Reticulomyxa filosa]|eukprot:ETO16463.1 hypothetical protein RFI_20879 [Reticulomyxa filosa]